MVERTINSRRFRTDFIRLTERTVVTALGRPIGVWQPISVAIDTRALDGIWSGEPSSSISDQAIRENVEGLTLHLEAARMLEGAGAALSANPTAGVIPEPFDLSSSATGGVYPQGEMRVERATATIDFPTPRSLPETPAVRRTRAPKGNDEARTQATTGESDTGSPVTAVEADGGGTHATGGSLDSAPPTRRNRQAARDKILRGVNRGGMP